MWDILSYTFIYFTVRLQLHRRRLSPPQKATPRRGADNPQQLARVLKTLRPEALSITNNSSSACGTQLCHPCSHLGTLLLCATYH